MKKITLSLFLFVASFYAFAQNGLENIIVERYYVSNAADAAGSIGALPTGSVTYRIYADMLPNYKFQAVYGVPGHEFRIATTTAFFNNEDYGGTAPTNSATNVRKNSVLLDSYFSVGGAASGKMGVLKYEDTDGSTGNANNILQNNDPTASGPINFGTANSLLAQDGMITGTPQSVTFVGLTTELDVFDGLSNTGNLFSTSNASIASLNGSTGPNPSNIVLIAQLTTNGALSFELNIQIGTPTGGIQNYVAKNPVGNEILASFLTYPLVASVNIAANNPGPICSKTDVTFTATPINGGVSPTYQWKRNGINTGTNSPVFTNGNLANNDQISCTMTSSLPGVSGSPANSNTITMQVNALPNATLTSTGPTTFCAGTTPLTLNANLEVGLTYQWFEGPKVLGGATSSSYVPTKGGTYKVRTTNVNGCTKFSTSINVTRNTLPAASFTASGPLTFCSGDSVLFTANTGAGLTYQWKRGSNLVNGATLPTFTAKLGGSYKVIVTNANGCTKVSANKDVVINCKTNDLNSLSSNSGISIFPIPTSGPFTLSYSNDLMENSYAQLEIVNVLGEVVYNEELLFSNGSLTSEIDLSKNGNGIYLIRLVLNNEILTSRVIVQ